MEIQKDILGNIPKVGDTIVFNPPKYKGLLSGEITSFTKSGLPKIEKINGNVTFNWSLKYAIERDGFYSVKTGFAIIK